MSDTQKNANSSNDETVFDNTRQVGRVKWFNNRAGFGFITMLEGEKKGEDVFTHHSGISVIRNSINIWFKENMSHLN